ncbi:hypothetical protein W824_09180 [Clavibacter cf. michiganensis LMG 26808]|nr:hypothetical protein W824_09180 [Clavibacter cf. michiganensis LMG 26808]
MDQVLTTTAYLFITNDIAIERFNPLFILHLVDAIE